jgi:hypothetical protein
MGVVLASLFSIDLPFPIGEAADGHGVPYVPASGEWVDLGAPARPQSQPAFDAGTLQSDALQPTTTVDPSVVPVGDKSQKRPQGRARGVPGSVLPRL